MRNGFYVKLAGRSIVIVGTRTALASTVDKGNVCLGGAFEAVNVTSNTGCYLYKVRFTGEDVWKIEIVEHEVESVAPVGQLDADELIEATDHSRNIHLFLNGTALYVVLGQ